MKTRKAFIIVILVSVIMSFLNLSCQMTRKTALSCPEISIKKSNYRTYHKKSKSTFWLAKNENRKNRKIPHSKQVKNGILFSNSIDKSSINNNYDISSIEYKEGLLASTENISLPLIKETQLSPSSIKKNQVKYGLELLSSQQTKCDTIYLKSGALIIGKVEEIGPYELKYRKCNNLSGPIILLRISDVTSINYSNGTNDYINSRNSFNAVPADLSQVNTTPAKIEGLGIAGFVAGLVGLFIASIPLGIIATIFGFISLSKIKGNPQRYRGKGFAIASIILGLIDVVVMLIVLTSM